MNLNYVFYCFLNLVGNHRLEETFVWLSSRKTVGIDGEDPEKVGGKTDTVWMKIAAEPNKVAPTEEPEKGEESKKRAIKNSGKVAGKS